MSSSDTGVWREPLQRLTTADTAQEAYLAAADVVDAALPGGSILAGDADELVRNLRIALQDPALRFPSCVLVILYWVACWSSVWRMRISHGDARAVAQAGAAKEAVVARRLAEVAFALGTWLQDPDPEVRAMCYLFLGAAEDNAKALQSLAPLGHDEVDELAMACAVQAVVALSSRFAEDPSDGVLKWVRRLIKDGPMAVRSRVARELALASHTEDQRQRIVAISGLSLSELSNQADLSWPSERIA